MTVSATGFEAFENVAPDLDDQTSLSLSLSLRIPKLLDMFKKAEAGEAKGEGRNFRIGEETRQNRTEQNSTASTAQRTWRREVGKKRPSQGVSIQAALVVEVQVEDGAVSPGEGTRGRDQEEG